MPKRWPQSVKDKVIELRLQGLPMPEIVRRLNEDQAGLGFAAPIKLRTAHEYVSQHRAKHGPLAAPAPETIDADSIAKAQAAIYARILREVNYFERKAVGRLTVEQSRVLAEHHRTLEKIATVEARAAKRRKAPSRAREAGAPEKAKPASAIEALRQQQEASIATEGPHSTDPDQDTAPGNAATSGNAAAPERVSEKGSGARIGGSSSPTLRVLQTQPDPMHGEAPGSGHSVASSDA